MSILVFYFVVTAFIALCIYGVRRTLKDVRVARSRPLLPQSLTKIWKKFFRKKKKTKRGRNKKVIPKEKTIPKGKSISKGRKQSR